MQASHEDRQRPAFGQDVRPPQVVRERCVERNAQGDVLGIMFYGRGWGHGVGMCQVGAYGMARDGATYEQILKKYYNGIDLKKLW